MLAILSKKRFVFVLLAALVHSWCFAQTLTNVNAHVHGLAEMTIAIEKQTLEIEFTAPGADLVGFEHSANSKDELEQVNKTQLQLSNTKQLFSFMGGQCQIHHKKIDLSSFSKPDLHTKSHFDEEHQLNHHKSNHNAENKKTTVPQMVKHSELRAVYHYQCKNIAELSAITVTLFDEFPGIEQMNVLWLNDGEFGIKHGAIMLSTDDNVVHF